MDVDLDRALIDIGIEAEDVIEDLGLADGLARLVNQELEHGVLAGREREQLTVKRKFPCIQIEGKLAINNRRRGPVARTTQLHADAGFKFFDFERLGEIIIGTRIK